MFKKSINHLEDNDMTYWEHFRFASGYGVECIYHGLLLILHSIIPAYFERTGSKLVNKLNKVFTEQNEYLSLKNRVEAFKKIVYYYRSKELK
jgi:hypothetical protein|tara:strand:- start:289 stop:564 length:276 start_codon:yes stop_codon:yes gene_type:complete